MTWRAKPYGPRTAWESAVRPLGYMGISVQSASHTGDPFTAMVSWINQRADVQRVRINVSDGLHAFNIAQEQGISLEEARRRARVLGDAWLESNGETLKAVAKPLHLTRWDDWPKPRIEMHRKHFASLASESVSFANSLREDASRFIQRKYGMDIDSASSEIVTTSMAYLIEELSVYSEIFRDFPATSYYPGRSLSCFTYLRQNPQADAPNAISKTSHIRLALHQSADPKVEGLHL